MAMQEIRAYENEPCENGQYARTEEELYAKAVALLEKCKIASQPSGQGMSDSTTETSPTNKRAALGARTGRTPL